MALELLSVVVGLVLGGAAVAIVMEVMGRTRAKDAVRSKLTTGWRLSELGHPVVVARDVQDVPVPTGTTVLASGMVAPEIIAACTVHHAPTVRAEFALDREGGRALLFLGGLRPGSLAMLTVDEDLVARLETEFKRLHDRAAEYVERLDIASMAGRSGVPVETQGMVQEVLPYQGRWMLRLEDQGNIIGVLVDRNPTELREQRILVKGQLERDATGYTIIEAQDIRRIQ